MSFRKAVIAAALTLWNATSALAQFPTPGPTEQPGPFVREAFASPYGRVLMAEFGRALRADADPACLNSKGIVADQLAPRGEELMLRWSTRAMEIALSYVDFQAYEKSFTGSA